MMSFRLDIDANSAISFLTVSNFRVFIESIELFYYIMQKPTYPKSINQYNITTELGKGSFAVVCKCFNKQNRRNYAVKVFPKKNLVDSGEIERFQREINSMAYLRHDNMVALHDFFWDETNFYMIIDFCGGGELFDYIIKHDHLEEPLAAMIFEQIVSAIAYCHSYGVAHRDLKPENILIDKFPRVKVSDFGLCGFIDNQQLMKTFCGSPTYCAPECLAKVQYDGRLSDVWSLGVILYAMVTGNNPWNSSNTTAMLHQIMSATYEIPSNLSSECADLITQMLQREANNRIKIDDILEHPWIKEKTKCKIPMPKPAMVPKDAPAIPSLNGLTMEQISVASKQSSQISSHGVFSPFETTDTDVSDESEGRLPLANMKQPSMPALICVRSASIGNFKARITSPRAQGTRRFVPTNNLSISANRQRSDSNFYRKMPLPSLSGSDMQTINED